MLAAATMMLAACAETDLLNEVNVESNGQAIGFSTFAGKSTRAENSTVTETLGLEEHHETFKVWAYKNTMTDYVFEDVTVAIEGGVWTYNPKKYWDKAANTYDFYAAAPSSVNWALNTSTAAQNDDFFTLNDFQLVDETHSSTEFQESFKTLTKNKDLMIATSKHVLEYEILSATKVQFEFNHILSRLNITVKKAANLTQLVELKSISVVGLVNIANFSEATAAVPAGTNTRWTKTTNTYTLNGNPVAVVDDTNKKYVLQSLVIPQDAAYEDIDRDGTSTELCPYLYIEYEIGGEPFNATYNLANAFGVTTKVSFNEGWQNTLNITLDAAAIEFDAVTFKWEEVEESNKTID